MGGWKNCLHKLSLVRYCSNSHGPWHAQPIMKFFKSSKLKIKCFFLLVITKELKDRGLRMDLCGKYFSRKNLFFSSGHNLTCHTLCVPKTLHCRNTDKMVLPTKLKIKLRSNNKNKTNTQQLFRSAQWQCLTDNTHNILPSCLLPQFYRGWLVHQRKAEHNNEVEMVRQNSTEIFVFYVDTYLHLFFTSPHLQTYTKFQLTTQPKMCSLSCLSCKLSSDGQNWRAAEFS